jgi:hypothetical protein
MILPHFFPNLPIGSEPDDTFWLVSWEDLGELLASGEFERMDKTEAECAMFDARPDHDEVEQFLSRLAGHSWLSSTGCDLKPSVLKELLERGELVAIRESGENALDPSQRVLLEQRKITRTLAPILRSVPIAAGRKFVLVPGIDLHRVPHRDSYHVVNRAEATSLLKALAGHQGMKAEACSAITKAITLLSPDWRPPRPPQGLVLLREVPRVAASAPPQEVITPSQMRALMQTNQEANLEVVVLGMDDKPLPDIYFTIEAPDDEPHEGNLGSSGKTKLTSTKRGTATVTLSWDKPDEAN